MLRLIHFSIFHDFPSANDLRGGIYSRVQQALDTDADRLELECIAIADSVQSHREKREREIRAMELYSTAYEASGSTGGSQQRDAEMAYLNEIQWLESECSKHEAEHRQLTSLLREQAVTSTSLDDYEMELEMEQNALEMDGIALDKEQTQLACQLQLIQAELEQLTLPATGLMSMVINLQVDVERGLRYPLINNLRLAYRPKGDVKWSEIQAAWSLAAQLLLAIGTVFDFPSQQWKIVPLSHCAKLIFFDAKREKADPTHASSLPAEGSDATAALPIVYNLGHPLTNASESLRAWSELLRQVLSHAQREMDKVYSTAESGSSEHAPSRQKIASAPYNWSAPAGASPALDSPQQSIGVHVIVGDINLATLDVDDHAGWSRVVHILSSNLQWLSRLASAYLRQELGSMHPKV
jgi:Apg6 BARA domain